MISAAIPDLIFGILTLIGQFIITVILIVLFFSFLKKKSHKLLDFLNKYAVASAFVVALIAMIGSLTYSELVGYTPCELCWFQRILMYPQVLILGIAILKKDENVFDYIIGLSSIGVLIAAYHYILQIGFAPSICSLSGDAVNCAQAPFFEFGYITISMMSLTAFSMILLYMLVMKLHKSLRRKTEI